jgi:hypothetical protein
MQNQKIELSDVLKVIKQDSIQEAEEALLVSEELRENRVQAQNQAAEKAKADFQQKEIEFKKEEWAHEGEMIVLKEEERRKTEIQKQTILSMGFDINKDQDSDGVPDVLEVAKHGVDANIRISEEARKSRELDFQISDAKEKNKLKEKEIAQKGAGK